MSPLAAGPDLRTRLVLEPNIGRKIGMLAGVFILQAASEIQEGGWAKHEAVKAQIKRELVGPDPTEEAFERLFDELLDLQGFAEAGSDVALKALPVEQLVDRFLDAYIRGLYVALRDAGMIE